MSRVSFETCASKPGGRLTSLPVREGFGMTMQRIAPDNRAAERIGFPGHAEAGAVEGWARCDVVLDAGRRRRPPAPESCSVADARCR